MFSEPIPDKKQTLAGIIKKIEFAVKIGDPFLIEKAYKSDYISAGGNLKDLDKYIEQAKINEAKKPAWDKNSNTCPYCRTDRR